MEGVNLKAIGYIWGGVAIAAIIFFIIKSRQLKLKESGQLESVLAAKMHNKYLRYMNNVLTRKSFRRIVSSMTTLTCYSVQQIKEESVKLFERSVIKAVLMPFAALIAFQNMFLAALTGFVGYIYYSMSVDGKIDKLYREIVQEITECVQSINDGYITSGSIPTAVLNCERGKYLDKAISRIHEILTCGDGGEEMLYAFKCVTPVRIIGTLASVCFILNNEGDIGKGGEQSTFQSVMIALRREADTEVTKLKKTEAAFKSLKGVALTGLIASPLLDVFLLNAIPGVALYLKGMYGFIEKSIIVCITIVSYYIISVMNRPTVVNQVDRIDFIDNLSKKRWVRDKVVTIIPKKFKTRQKLDMMLQDSISSKTLEYIYTMKPVMALLAMVGTLIMLMGFVWTAKYNLWTYTGSLSVIESTQEMTEKLERQLKELDKEYMTQEIQLESEAALNLVKSKLTGVNDMDALNHVSRLEQKWKTYYGLGFKWYFIIIMYMAAVVGWFSPELSLMLRKKSVGFEAVEDAMQLQTLMIALASTKMSVYTCLHWMTSESTIHKAPLHYAYLEYPSAPELAIQRLKDSVQSKELKRIISKLDRAIYSLSLADAFNDIKLDKEQSLVESELVQNEVIESKKQWAKLISGIPTGIAIMGGFVLPILILGVVQLMTSLSSM